MNRFLKNKKEKAKEAKVAKDVKESKVAEEENEFSLGGIKSFKKNRKPEPEQKPQLDLSTALPSNEDFRTSLLMPKLSARFSMLKEQDDPGSVLGKASDDSVLFPKRASRLNIFGHNPSLLSDIDEVSSIDGSRPSFAMGRADSYGSGGDGYGTDDDPSPNGSIMNRPRRGEGNNLFGGRQKIYKIPMKPDGASPGSEEGRTTGGRAVYEDDISTSPFQRLKSKEKEDRAADHGQEAHGPESDDALSGISSTQRTTYSSTTSGPPNGRASTAATSIDEPFSHSQFHTPAGELHSAAFKPPGMGSERGSMRSRRLYGQGLAQSAQNQQASTLHRLEGLSRQRAGTPDLPPLNRNYSRSAANLRDGLQKLAIAEPAPQARPTSPPSSLASPNRLAVENESKDPKTHPSHAPLTPPISENEEGTGLAAAVQPEDRGKATAMGLFNKPNARFDEQQFTRRQLQMHEGRNTPPLKLPGRPPTQNSFDRPRGFSNASHPSRPESASSQQAGMRRTAEQPTVPSAELSPTEPGTTFFADSRSSQSGDEMDPRRSAGASSSSSQRISNVHPALRSGTPSKPSSPRESQSAMPEVRYSELSDLKPIEENDAPENSSSGYADPASPEKPDSPTLGPTGLGLSGWVHTHLRHDSDSSSIHSPPSGDRQPAGNGSNGANSEPHMPPRGEPEQDELRSKHTRGGSTETQKEREEFANELAERRRKVQEKLKSFAETESRASSPVPGSRSQTPDLTQGKPSNAFSILKSSGKHMLNKHDKSGNMFNLANTSTPTLDSDGYWRDESERFPYGFGKQSNASSPHVGAERPIYSRMRAASRGSPEDSRESSRSRGPSPQSGFRTHRDRSSSETSGRSKSRTRYRDRDDLGTLAEGSVASHEAYAPEYSDSRHPPSVPSSVPSSARPSVESSDPFDRSMSAASGRYRSASRSGMSGYDAPIRPIQPLQPFKPSESIGASPRPSPVAPYSANATPPLYELRQRPQSPNLGSAPVSIPQRAPGHVALQKRAIVKTQISEPTFVSSTSNVPTVGLPPGATLSNGNQPPPVPPMNPRRRRQTTTQTILGALKGDRPELHHPMLTEEQRSYSDGGERYRPRNKLRKSSSEGGNMNVKARQEAMAEASPPVPQYPQNAPMDGGMI